MSTRRYVVDIDLAGFGSIAVWDATGLRLRIAPELGALKSKDAIRFDLKGDKSWSFVSGVVGGLILSQLPGITDIPFEMPSCR